MPDAWNGRLRGRSAHFLAGLVGEQTAVDSSVEGIGHTRTQKATHGGRTSEDIGKDGLQGRKNILIVVQDHREHANEIDQGHGGNQLGGRCCDPLNAPQYDQCKQHTEHGTCQPGLNAECGAQAAGNAVHLRHIARTERTDDGGNGEEDRHPLHAQFVLHIVHGTRQKQFRPLQIPGTYAIA